MSNKIAFLFQLLSEELKLNASTDPTVLAPVEQAPAPASASPIPIGTKVVLRDHMAGVYMGELVSLDPVSGVTVLKNARQSHYWTGAAATPGLAVRGPKHDGSRIGPTVETIVGRSLVSVMPCTPEAVLQWTSAPVWTP